VSASVASLCCCTDNLLPDYINVQAVAGCQCFGPLPSVQDTVTVGLITFPENTHSIDPGQATRRYLTKTMSVVGVVGVSLEGGNVNGSYDCTITVDRVNGTVSIGENFGTDASAALTILGRFLSFVATMDASGGRGNGYSSAQFTPETITVSGYHDPYGTFSGTLAVSDEYTHEMQQQDVTNLLALVPWTPEHPLAQAIQKWLFRYFTTNYAIAPDPAIALLVLEGQLHKEDFENIYISYGPQTVSADFLDQFGDISSIGPQFFNPVFPTFRNGSGIIPAPFSAGGDGGIYIFGVAGLVYGVSTPQSGGLITNTQNPPLRTDGRFLFGDYFSPATRGNKLRFTDAGSGTAADGGVTGAYLVSQKTMVLTTGLYTQFTASQEFDFTTGPAAPVTADSAVSVPVPTAYEAVPLQYVNQSGWINELMSLFKQ